MRRLLTFLPALALLSACAGSRVDTAGSRAPMRPGGGQIEVGIIAFNDFHGALEPPSIGIDATTPDGHAIKVPAGGAAYLASAVREMRARHRNSIVVSAGDLTSASPLPSAQFLDEPTVLAMNMIGLDLNAVGNHEFDRGSRELLRLQNGGCEQFTARAPCRLDRDFPGGRYRYLAANVRTDDGATLFPAYQIRTFGSGASRVRIAFIGLTLKETATLVSPNGVAGLHFEDEANTINALVPRVRAEGADAVVVLIHQGLSTKVGYDDHSCNGVDGDLLPILARLDPSISLVVSGHTHNAYICDYGRIDPSRPFLVTSAGKSGSLLTDITLTFDARSRRVIARQADNRIVQSTAFGSGDRRVETTALFPSFTPDPQVAALVARYVAASAPIAARVIGRLSGSASKEQTPSGESVLGDLIADAHLAATRAPENGGAQLAFTNQFGLRTDLVPSGEGAITYGQIFAVQPFGNTLMVRTYTGRQIRAALEQQFASATSSLSHRTMLLPSGNVTVSYDLDRPAGQRIVDVTLDGAPIQDGQSYRVALNNFLAFGGDGFSVFRDGTNTVGGVLDLEALEHYFGSGQPIAVPAAARIRNLTREGSPNR